MDFTPPLRIKGPSHLVEYLAIWTQPTAGNLALRAVVDAEQLLRCICLAYVLLQPFQAQLGRYVYSSDSHIRPIDRGPELAWRLYSLPFTDNNSQQSE